MISGGTKMDYNDLADEDDEVEDDDFDDGEDAEKYDYRRDPDLLNKEDALRGEPFMEPLCLKVL